jgi:hypothetical protein
VKKSRRLLSLSGGKVKSGYELKNVEQNSPELVADHAVVAAWRNQAPMLYNFLDP